MKKFILISMVLLIFSCAKEENLDSTISPVKTTIESLSLCPTDCRAEGSEYQITSECWMENFKRRGVLPLSDNETTHGFKVKDGEFHEIAKIHNEDAQIWVMLGIKTEESQGTLKEIPEIVFLVADETKSANTYYNLLILVLKNVEFKQNIF